MLACIGTRLYYEPLCLGGRGIWLIRDRLDISHGKSVIAVPTGRDIGELNLIKYRTKTI